MNKMNFKSQRLFKFGEPNANGIVYPLELFDKIKKQNEETPIKVFLGDIDYGSNSPSIGTAKNLTCEDGYLIADIEVDSFDYSNFLNNVNLHLGINTINEAEVMETKILKVEETEIDSFSLMPIPVTKNCTKCGRTVLVGDMCYNCKNKE